MIPKSHRTTDRPRLHARRAFPSAPVVFAAPAGCQDLIRERCFCKPSHQQRVPSRSAAAREPRTVFSFFFFCAPPSWANPGSSQGRLMLRCDEQNAAYELCDVQRGLTLSKRQMGDDSVDRQPKFLESLEHFTSNALE